MEVRSVPGEMVLRWTIGKRWTQGSRSREKCCVAYWVGNEANVEEAEGSEAVVVVGWE